MPKGKLGSGECARRTPDDRNALKSESVEKRYQNICLMSGRGIVRKRAAQVSEARRRNDLKAALAQGSAEQQTLIETPSGAVDHHERRPTPGDCVFQRTGFCSEKAAAHGEPRFSAGHRRAVRAKGRGTADQGDSAHPEEHGTPRSHGTR